MIPTFEGNEQGIKKILCQRKQEISDAMWMSGVNFHLKAEIYQTKLSGTEKPINILKYSLDQK